MAVSDALKTKRTELQTMLNQYKTLYAEAEQKGADKVTADERTKLDNLFEAGKRLRAEVDQLEFVNAEDEKTATNGERKAQDAPPPRPERKSVGARVIGAPEYKSRQNKHGGATVRFTDDLSIKAIYGGTDATGGYAVDPMRVPEIFDIARQRPFSVLDLVNQSQTTVDAVEYIEMDTRTNNAAVVPEFTGGNFGLKPESNIALDLETATVKTIATWIASSRQILADAPRLRDMIDNELSYMVRLHLENQILTGDGVGNNFTGIINWSGIQSRVHAVSGRDFDANDSISVSLRRALTDIRVEFYEPTAIVIHPTDAELMEVDEYTSNRFYNAFDPVTMRVWRIPVVETAAMTEATALVGNFRLGATLWDRMATEIRVGEPNDFFLRNAVAILAELRAAFAVTRPKAFEKVTGLAAMVPA